VARSIGRWMNSVWTELRECQCWPLGELGLDRVGWVPMLAPGWTRSGPSCVSANVGHSIVLVLGPVAHCQRWPLSRVGGNWRWRQLRECQCWPLSGHLVLERVESLPTLATGRVFVCPYPLGKLT